MVLERTVLTSQRIGVDQTSGVVTLSKVLECRNKARKGIFVEVWCELCKYFPLRLGIRVRDRMTWGNAIKSRTAELFK